MFGEISDKLSCPNDFFSHEETGVSIAWTGHIGETRKLAAPPPQQIFELYERHGADFVRHLPGSFAVALHDPRKSQWFLARDRAGTIPLYYTRTSSGSLFFSTTIRPLLFHVDSVELHGPALVDFLTHLWALDGKTFFKGIKLLAQGAVLTAQGERRYFSLEHKTESRSEEEWRQAILETFDACIRDAATPAAACHLSGGIDSSLVAEALSRLTGQPAAAYCVSFPDYPAYDETPFARIAATRVGANLHEVPVRPADFPKTLPTLLRVIEEPKCHPPVFTRFILEAATRAGGHDTVLTGRGADELFTGYDAHRKENLRDHRQRRTIFDATQRTALIQPDFASTFEYDVRGAYDQVFDSCPGQQPLEQIMAFDFQTLMANWMVLDYKISAHHEAQCIAPFLDQRMIDLALSIPLAVKCPGDSPKALLRDTVRGRLPEEIVTREKVGFRTPMGEMMRDGLEEYIRDTLQPDQSACWDYLNPKGVQSIVREHFSGQRNLGWQIWGLLSFKEWCKAFLDTREWQTW